MRHQGLAAGQGYLDMTVKRTTTLATRTLMLFLWFGGLMTIAAAEPRKSEPGDGLVSGIKVGKIIDGGPRYGHPRRGDQFSLPRHCGPDCLEIIGYRRIPWAGYSGHCR